MPLSLNAIFGIPTREEKFTAARDAKQREYDLERMQEAERLARGRASFIEDEVDRRGVSTLMAANPGMDVNTAKQQWNQGRAAEVAEKRNKYNEAMGASTLSTEVGRTGARRQVAENVAGETTAGAVKNESENRWLVARLLNPKLPAMTLGDVGVKLGGQKRAVAENTRGLHEANRGIINDYALSDLRRDAEAAQLAGVAPLINQRLSQGEASTLGAWEMLPAEIAKAQAQRRLWEDPTMAAIMSRGYKPYDPNMMSLLEQGGAPSLAPNPAVQPPPSLKDILINLPNK